MFTQTLTRRVRRSPLLELLTGPHGVDRYTELVDPTWTLGEARAKVVAVRRQTPRSVTLTLEPNRAFTGFRAGQHINLTVEIDGRRRTRCYSPASAESATSHRADHRPPRRRPGVDVPVRPRPPRHGASDSTRSAATSRCLPSAPAHPVRLRRQRHHPGDVDAADDARRGLRGRDRLRPLRAQRRRSLLCRRARHDDGSPGAARLHPRRRRRPDRLLRRRPPGRRDARRRTPFSSADRPRSWKPSGRTVPTRNPRASSRRCSALRPNPPEAESRSPTAVSRPPTTAGRCCSRPRTPASPPRADAGWASATPAPAARPAAR